VELENQIAKGIKLDLATTLNPAKAQQKSAILTAIYKQASLHSRATVDLLKVGCGLRPSLLHLSLVIMSSIFGFAYHTYVPKPLLGTRAPLMDDCTITWKRADTQGPTFTADTVVGRDGFLVGLEGSYDVTAGSITRYAGALGYAGPDYTMTLHGLGKLSTFAASYYHKVSKDVEAGAKAVYDTKSTTGGVSLEVGAKTYLVSSCLLHTTVPIPVWLESHRIDQ
jgi:voltage-dependent anion channel protein 2